MKYFESKFYDYVQKVKKFPFSHYNSNFIELNKNIILYGPSGIGKYSFILYALSRESPSELKVQNKIVVQKNSKLKEQYIYLMSDIHFEIDMSLLGCNSKTLWSEIYMQIIEIVLVHPNQYKYIVCKNFHLIHAELLEYFYSYIKNTVSNIDIKYILLTEHISFIPNNIFNYFSLITLKRPNLLEYQNIVKANIGTDIDANIAFPQNIKDLYVDKELSEVSLFEQICGTIINQIISPKLVLITFRDSLYDILTYGLDISETLWYIISHLIKKNVYSDDQIPNIMHNIYLFLKLFNNNYRPIPHLESIFVFLHNLAINA